MPIHPPEGHAMSYKCLSTRAVTATAVLGRQVLPGPGQGSGQVGATFLT